LGYILDRTVVQVVHGVGEFVFEEVVDRDEFHLLNQSRQDRVDFLQHVCIWSLVAVQTLGSVQDIQTLGLGLRLGRVRDGVA